LLEWNLLESFEPWGQKRLDWHYARLMAAIYTAAGVRKEDKKPYTGTDFLIEFKDPWPTEDDPKMISETPEHIERVITEWVMLHNQAWAAREAHRAAVEGRSKES